VNEFTLDTFFNGQIKVKQSRAGYRFSIDAVLLASHVAPQPDDIIVDLGTGCGIIPLILGFHYPRVRIYGIEVQKELVDLARENVRENRMANRIDILLEDMKDTRPPTISEPVDIVMSNPPYRKATSGRINPNRQRANARHELSITLPEVAQTAGRLLHKSGRFVMIYIAERMVDAVNQMRSNGIEPKFIRTIHSTASSEAKLVLLEGRKGGRPGATIASPLVIYQSDGRYTEEVQQMFQAGDGAKAEF
jgi:tRNA1Val (adenine37-N6)-methyltransferase